MEYDKEEGSVKCGTNNSYDDVSMRSEYSFSETPGTPYRIIHFDNSDSEESMSIPHSDLEDDYYYREGEDEDEDDKVPELESEHIPSWRATKWLPAKEASREAHRRQPNRSERRCMRCEAYDAHCKSAAENYRRTLTSYTKTVSELMIGFKAVLERYPELRVDSSNDHIRYMAQAALGRNNLVQEMVRLAAKRQMREFARTEPEKTEAVRDSAIVSMHEALNTCHSDREALRMVLQHYTDLYVRYIGVWREMCSKVSRDITVMECINLTQDRPGVKHGEPWSEAKAYVARMLDKVVSITPRLVGEACARALKTINSNLSYTPTDFTKHKGVIDASIEDIRDRLDKSSQHWSWDSCMTDLYYDIRSDLTVLETLVGVGEISVKTLLYERSMLVSQVRKITRNEGSLELQIAQTRSKLRDSVIRCRCAEINAL